MATIPSPEECLIRKANQKLFEELYNLFDYWDIGLWKDTDMSELAEIWVETIEQCSPVLYDENTVKKEFVNKIMERMVDIQ